MLLAAVSLTQMGHARSAPTPGGHPMPKLVVVVVADGLAQEQLLKNYPLFVEGGFRRLMDKGAWFSDAHQGHAFTVTAPGHAAILSGAYPYQHGIIGNEWRLRDGTFVYCVGDAAHRYLDSAPTVANAGTSPRNLQVSTVGDELRYANNNLSRVFAVSMKDRSAILLAGKTGTAYVYRSATGAFASTSYYMSEHPPWVAAFFADKPQDKYFKQSWAPLLPTTAYVHSTPARFNRQLGLAMEAPNPIYYGQLGGSPYGDSFTADFATTLIEQEGLGKNPANVPDVIAVSFSALDSTNHTFGPESLQSADHVVRLDRILSKFFAGIDKQVGSGNALIVLTADHGFMNAPDFSKARQFDAGRIDANDMLAAANKTLADKFGLPKLITQYYTGGATLDYAAAELKGINRATLEPAARRALLAFPGINFVFTRSQLEEGTMPATRVGRLVTRAWNVHSASDLVFIQKPFHFFQSKTSTSSLICSHGTPYSYDTNVPLLIEGAPWIRAGRYTAPAEVVDIAPTLSTILNIRPPSAAEGRVLTEALK